MVRVKFSHIYLGAFSLVLIYLGIYTISFFHEGTKITVLRADYNNTCSKDEFGDVTSKVKKQCDGLQVCNIVHESKKLDPLCPPELRVEWSCQKSGPIKSGYKLSGFREHRVFAVKMTIDCPGREFTSIKY